MDKKRAHEAVPVKGKRARWNLIIEELPSRMSFEKFLCDGGGLVAQTIAGFLTARDVGCLVESSKTVSRYFAGAFEDKVFFWSFGGRWIFKHYVNPKNAVVYLNGFSGNPWDFRIPPTVNSISIVSESVIGATAPEAPPADGTLLPFAMRHHASKQIDTQIAWAILSRKYLTVAADNFMDTLLCIGSSGARGVALGNNFTPHEFPDTVRTAVLGSSATDDTIKALPPGTTSLSVYRYHLYSTPPWGSLRGMCALTELRVCIMSAGEDFSVPDTVKDLYLQVEAITTRSLKLPESLRKYHLSSTQQKQIGPLEYECPTQWPPNVEELFLDFFVPFPKVLPEGLKRLSFMRSPAHYAPPECGRLPQTLVTAVLPTARVPAGVVPPSLRYLACYIVGADMSATNMTRIHIIDKIVGNDVFHPPASAVELVLPECARLANFPPNLTRLHIEDLSDVEGDTDTPLPFSLEELSVEALTEPKRWLLFKHETLCFRVVTLGSKFNSPLFHLPLSVEHITVHNLYYDAYIATNPGVRTLRLCGYCGGSIELPPNLVKFTVCSEFFLSRTDHAKYKPAIRSRSPIIAAKSALQFLCIDSTISLRNPTVMGWPLRVLVIAGSIEGDLLIPPTVTRLYLNTATIDDINRLPLTIALICVKTLNVKGNMQKGPLNWKVLPVNCYAACDADTYDMFYLPNFENYRVRNKAHYRPHKHFVQSSLTRSFEVDAHPSTEIYKHNP